MGRALGDLPGKLLRDAGKGYTLLFLSPLSKHVVDSFIEVAVAEKAPVAFAASLNQVDLDGGYTGWTPSAFAEYVRLRLAEVAGENYPLILQLDHGGPWFKDKHIEKSYSYEEAVEDFLKSLEGFLRAGFQILHIDATIDLNNPSRNAEPEVAASRTAGLITHAEHLAAEIGVYVLYEVGSDRWGYKPPESYEGFLSTLVHELKARGIDPSKVVFSAAHVGTEVRPGNRVDRSALESFVSLMSARGLKLKVHSGDYLENPELLPEVGVGGVNIGPMFAHVMYSSIVKTLSTSKLDPVEAQRYIQHFNELIISSDRLSKYTREGIEEYKLGLASRYAWSKLETREFVRRVSQILGQDLNALLKQRLKEVMRTYLYKLNLNGLVEKLGK